MNKLSMTALALLLAGAAHAKTFSHPTNGYTLSYPDAWSAQANFAGTDLTIAVPSAAGAPSQISVVTQALPDGMNLAAYAAATAESLPRMLQRFTLTSDKTLKVNGVLARDFVFGGHRNGRAMYGHVLLIVKGSVGYTVSYLGAAPKDAAAKKAIDAVLASFKTTR
ncbi:PsbP-related protein [Deinococcus yavapaiensis]|uniref:Uncharacterized protein DUF1795 n=1 Tax=Deinococcus yavapaiensis KR-236 TaxID=694435 RepID=A0A318SDH0_9DEIO|nr:DcrB-related protein [Deinococcus yavapaiensis]PYE55414.1 uncharacterized protein DUF1795 [Deinococcus yavapaiensis KR-236]